MSLIFRHDYNRFGNATDLLQKTHLFISQFVVISQSGEKFVTLSNTSNIIHGQRFAESQPSKNQSANQGGKCQEAGKRSGAFGDA